MKPSKPLKPFSQYLSELRKNPELNPKQSAWELLKSYYDKQDHNLYISFTNLNKLGINPTTKWSTPAGIYSYNIMDSWKFYALPDHDAPIKEYFPFAADRKFITIFKLMPNAKILYTSEYSENDYASDVEQIRNYLIQKENVSESMLDFIQARSESEAFKQHPFSWLWNYTRLLTKYQLKKRVKKEGSNYEEFDVNIHRKIENYKFNIPSRRSFLWSRLLKLLPYDVYEDDQGLRFIDCHEALQTLVLNKNVIEIIEVSDNRYYSQSRNFK